MAPPLGIKLWEIWLDEFRYAYLPYYKSQREPEKKPAGKTNQQGLENGYQMTKGPDLHHAQQSLTHLVNTKFNNMVNIDM